MARSYNRSTVFIGLRKICGDTSGAAPSLSIYELRRVIHTIRLVSQIARSGFNRQLLTYLLNQSRVRVHASAAAAAL
jgi:hypothetical protein